ncbi:hypothetical protein GCM10009661_61680 [Catellatospora chokoriensis]|uniref:PH domain-containing protein n=2 Tax=Catellatospora chokoriensis TaxID=310353 RepID=A0A8J3JZ44_9ACTN|nr:hypothetical protein Cch02nite_72000 [Catellatospora chokoriensis]
MAGMGRNAIFSWWQNALLAACGMVMAPVGLVLINHLLPRGFAAHDVLLAAAAAIWCGLCLLIVIRGTAQRVYSDGAHLVVRGPMRTLRIPWQDVLAVDVYEGVGNHGRRYFAPLVEYRPSVAATPRELPYDFGVPDGRVATARIYWLASTTPHGARRFADRIRETVMRSGSES